MGANIQLVQKTNRARVLNFIRKNPDTSRAIVSAETGLSMASITNITSYLLEKRLITESGTEEVERVGRKGSLFRFFHEAYGLICVQISNTAIDISYTDLNGNIDMRYRVNFDSSDLDKMQKMIAERVESLIRQYDRQNILAISLTVSGIVLKNNYFVLSASLRLKNFNLVSELEKTTGLPVFLNNVTQSRAVWSFCCTEHPTTDNMIFVDLKGGIGACQFYQGSLNNSMLGEIGHTTVDKDGDLCFCGNRGCLELMCSPNRIVQLYKEFSGVKSSPTFNDVAKLYYNGDKYALKAVDSCAEYLGIALANLINLFNPSTLTINVGDFSSLRDIIEKACTVMKERAYPALTDNLEIQEVNVGVYETIKGNVCTMCDRLFDENYENSIFE